MRRSCFWREMRSLESDDPNLDLKYRYSNLRVETQSVSWWGLYSIPLGSDIRRRKQVRTKQEGELLLISTEDPHVGEGRRWTSTWTNTRHPKTQDPSLRSLAFGLRTLRLGTLKLLFLSKTPRRQIPCLSLPCVPSGNLPTIDSQPVCYRQEGGNKLKEEEIGR